MLKLGAGEGNRIEGCNPHECLFLRLFSFEIPLKVPLLVKVSLVLFTFTPLARVRPKKTRHDGRAYNPLRGRTQGGEARGRKPGCTVTPGLGREAMILFSKENVMQNIVAIKTDASGRIIFFVEGNRDVTVFRDVDGRPLTAVSKNSFKHECSSVDFIYSNGAFTGVRDTGMASGNGFQSVLFPCLFAEAGGGVAASVDVTTAVNSAIHGVVAAMLPDVTNRVMLDVLQELRIAEVNAAVAAALAAAG
jgi:hypothetical protein